MKSVSTLYKENQARPLNMAVQYVRMKRRFWVPADLEYAWEDDWTTLATDEVISVGQIVGKLDTEQLNEFKISNVTLTLRNELNQWLPDNASGYFKALGAGAAAQNYFPFEPFWTKFQIVIGYMDRDGTEYTATVFTGLATKFNFDGQSDSVQVTVQGMESLLTNANAENVSTLVEADNVGTGDGTTTEFETFFNGVGIIISVVIADETMEEGVDFSVSQLNDPNLPAKITFTTPPPNGDGIAVYYRQWHADKRIEELIDLLLDEAGIGGAIEPVLFPNGVSQLFTQDTQTDFLAGTFSDTDANRRAGSVVLSFDDTSFKALLDDFNRGTTSTVGNGWTNQSSSPAAELNSNKLRLTTGSDGVFTLFPFITRPADRITGVWQFDFEFQSLTNGTLTFGFMVNGFTYTNTGFNRIPGLNGYAVQVTPSGQISLIRNFNPGVTIGSASWTADTSSHTIRIDRGPSGLMHVYLDGSLIIAVVDTTWMAGGFITIGSSAHANGILVDNVYWPSETVSGTFVTQTLDALTTPLEWGKVIGFTTPMAGSFSYETRSSADGISWDAYVALSVTGRIASTLRRYLQIKVTITTPTTGNSDPALDKLTASYINTATLLALANFTGKTCYQAIQELAKFANYEFGFDAAEGFFFRSKTVDRTIDMSLSHGDQISELSAMELGYERVYTEVVATFGAFTRRVTDDGKSPGQPAGRFVSRRFTVEGGSILLAPDVQIAEGIASVFFSDFRRPKRRFKIRTKLIPWIDLSDTLDVTFFDNMPARPWTLGDDDYTLGMDGIYFWGGKDQIASNLLSKVIGFRHDPERMQSEFDLEEILS